MASFLSLLSGGYGYLAAFLVGLALATGGTYYVVHNANASEISELKLAAQTKRADDTAASLAELNSFISNMHTAASGYATAVGDIDKRFATIETALQNAFKKPLPVDCKPDADRVRGLHSAIDATNANPSP